MGGREGYLVQKDGRTPLQEFALFMSRPRLCQWATGAASLAGGAQLHMATHSQQQLPYLGLVLLVSVSTHLTLSEGHSLLDLTEGAVGGQGGSSNSTVIPESLSPPLPMSLYSPPTGQMFWGRVVRIIL